MLFPVNPRGETPISAFPYIPAAPRTSSKQFSTDTISPGRRTRSILQKTNKKVCYDWIFSSSTNAHIAIDRAAFSTYTPFSSYVLSLSDGRRVDVEGIGSVELKIRCKPGSRNDRVIVLDDVLHIPSWKCNIFSDVYFLPSFTSLQDYEHTWTDEGVSFMVREKGKLKHWGYTESFCGLDKLVLSRKHEGGRSPMAEDKEREVYSVNVAWPQGQQDKWNLHAARKSRQSCLVIDDYGEIVCRENS